MHEIVLIMPHYDFQEILHWIPVVFLFLLNAFVPTFVRFLLTFHRLYFLASDYAWSEETRSPSLLGMQINEVQGKPHGYPVNRTHFREELGNTQFNQPQLDQWFSDILQIKRPEKQAEIGGISLLPVFLPAFCPGPSFFQQSLMYPRLLSNTLCSQR